MKKSILNILPVLALFVAFSLASCKSKPKDADLQTAIETALKADPAAASTMVSVTNGVATLTGVCADEACRTRCGDIAKGIKGVSSVVNNTTVAPPPPPPAPVEIAADDPLAKSVRDAIKDYAGVKADVKDGVVTLSGEIKKADLQKLMMSLNSLKPKKVDASALVKK